MHIYVTTQGTQVVREGRHLLVKKQQDIYRTLFVSKLRQLLLCGNVTLTPAARNLLLREKVDTVFLSRDGRYLGRFASPESKNVMLRKRQFELLDKQQFGVAVARSIVHAKLVSMMTLLMRIKRTRKAAAAGKAAADIRALLNDVAGAENIDSLRGYEGRGSAIYFGALQHGLQQDHGFRRRVRRPPTDRVNAVLSLLYTFLFNRVYGAIRQVNLDPYPAFLHTPDYGRHSLVMDLMEEFRVIVVDTLTLALFNLKVLQEEDFEVKARQREDEEKQDGERQKDRAPDLESDPLGISLGQEAGDTFDLPPQRLNDTLEDALAEEVQDKPAVILTPEAFRRVIENFERKLNTAIFYPAQDRKITYQQALVAQAGLYRKVIEGTVREYRPMVLK